MDCCTWKSQEISRFWDAHITPSGNNNHSRVSHSDHISSIVWCEIITLVDKIFALSIWCTGLPNKVVTECMCTCKCMNSYTAYQKPTSFSTDSTVNNPFTSCAAIIPYIHTYIHTIHTIHTYYTCIHTYRVPSKRIGTARPTPLFLQYTEYSWSEDEHNTSFYFLVFTPWCVKLLRTFGIRPPNF